MKNTFGNTVSMTIFGESHGPAVGAVLDGLAAGLPVDEAAIAAAMDRRRARGDGLSTARTEADAVEFLSGVYNGHTTGTAITLMVRNLNTRSSDYAKTADLLRPGHADYTAYAKYEGYQDARGGGHFSGRITAASVAAGALCESVLNSLGIRVYTHIGECAGIKDAPLSSSAGLLLPEPEPGHFALLDSSKEAPMQEAIRAAGWDDTSAPVLTMTFPGDRTITVTATEIGFEATPDAAAETAYAYGRSGNAFTNFSTWLRCALKGHDVAADNLADMDTDALRTRVEREAAEINVKLSGGSVEIDEEHSTIRVVKGASMITLDPAAVAERMLSDIRSGKFGTSAYPVDMSGDDKMTLQELHDAICGDPVNAGYDPETQSATESKVGIAFDVAEAQPLWDAASTGDTVTIPATLTQPEMTQERLQKHLLADKLATKTTSLSGSSSNRITNVKLAAEKINGVILQPGQTFSYNDVLGQRTKANGFKEAGAYSGGQVVQEVGGGICQVSSTLYYCAMVSNLKINTRTCHYFPVAYIEPGMDATVSWGGPEFKFTNSREYPIEIKAYVEKNSITVEIWGTDVDGSYVKMSYTANGLRATTYRTVYDKDGNEISRTVEANSTYHSHDTTPAPTPTPSATPTPTPTPKPQPTPYPSVYDPGDAGED